MKSLQQINITLSLAFLLAAGAVSADPVLQLRAGPMMDPVDMNVMGGVDNGDGTYDFDGEASMENMWSLTYDMTVDPDPFISANFSFANMSSMTQSFILSWTLPISPSLAPSSLVGGSFGGSLTDSNFDGNAAVGTVMGTAMYSGELDGVGVLPIYAHNTSFSASAFPGQTVNIPAANVGLPGPSIPGPAASSTIGITHTFTLTPGDSVSFTSFFVAEAIPEPTSVALMTMVGGAGFVIRRKFFS